MTAESPVFFWAGEPNLGFQDMAFLPSRAGYPPHFLEIEVEVTTSGFPQVYKLRFWVSKGIFLVEHLAAKIHMAVKYCGQQLA